MSEIAIHVENLGKLYRITERQQYRTLRDAIAKAFTLSQRKFKKSSKLKGYIWALKDVTFEVKKGEVVGIIGRNGSGKTTLLKILSRITPPTQGYAQVQGRVSSLFEVGTGFHPELTGRDNIYLNGAILGMRRQETSRKFDEIVAFAEIEKFIDTPLKYYSNGMYVRLAFSVAAHLEPEILLVDEVLAVGDAAFQKKCLGKMGDVAKGGCTVLFVSHNMAAIQSLCASTLLLERGRKFYFGAVEETVNFYLNSISTELSTGIILPSMHNVKSEKFIIEKVVINDSNGRFTTRIRINETIKIKVIFCVKQPIRGARIGLGFNTVTGIRIASIHHTDIGLEPFSGDVGKYEIEFNFKNPFLPNVYIVSVGAHLTLAGESLDYVPEALKFEVIEVALDEYVYHHAHKSDLIQLEGNWSLPRLI